MNNQELLDEVDRLLVKDETVKQVAAALYGGTVIGLVAVQNVLLPHLMEKYSYEESHTICKNIISVMHKETPADITNIELKDIIKLAEVNLKFLKSLEEYKER